MKGNAQCVVAQILPGSSKEGPVKAGWAPAMLPASGITLQLRVGKTRPEARSGTPLFAVRVRDRDGVRNPIREFALGACQTDRAENAPRDPDSSGATSPQLI